jgi:hypothetical protein
MAITFQRQQQSLIGAGDLPSARLTGAVADLSGLNRLGNAFLNAGAKGREEADRKKRQEDLLAGRRDYKDYVGIDENGNPKAFQLPDGTPEYRQGALDAAGANLEARFRSEFGEQLNGIQKRVVAGELTPEDADQIMREALTGALEASDPAFTAGFREYGEGQITQRTTLMVTQRANKDADLAATDLAASVTDEIKKASSTAAVGGDTTESFTRIDAGYDNLVRLNRMGAEEAKIAKAAVRQLVIGEGLVNLVVTAMARGEISADNVDRYGTAIETNDPTAEAVITKVQQTGPFSEVMDRQIYKSADVFSKVTDAAMRKEMGLKLRQAATDFKQRAAANAETIKFVDQLKYLGSDAGRNAKLPPEFHDDADSMMTRAMAATDVLASMDAPGGLLEHLGSTKYVPKPVANAIMSMSSSGNPEEVVKAVQAYRKITTLVAKGVAVGDILRQSIPDDVRARLENLDEGFRLGIPVEDLINNEKSARGKEEFTLGRLIQTYNTHAEDDDGFWKTLRTRWSEDYDVLPDIEVKDAFGTAYRQSMITLRDPEKAFAKAYEIVQGKYRKSEIMLSGIEAGSSDLTNPQGYEIRQPGGLLGPAAGAEHEWLNATTRDSVLEGMANGTILLPTFTDGEEISADEFKALLGNELPEPTAFDVDRPVASAWEIFTTPWQKRSSSTNWLGKTAKLVPVVGANPDAPEYMIRMFDKEGHDLGTLLHVGKDGYVEPFTINPSLEKGQANTKYSAKSILDASENAAKEGVMRLEDRILNQLTPEQQGAYDGKLPLSEYLPSVAPQLAEEYKLERGQIEEGLRSVRETYEGMTGETPPPSKISPQTLLQPRAAGFDVAAAAAVSIDNVLPDGTSGEFLVRIAAQESNFGKANGTFRLSGDKGITQVNTRSGYREVQRRIAMGKGRVFEASEKLKRELGLDIGAITTADLDKPLVAMAVARLYIEAVGRPVPQDVAGQANWWKRHYNTYLGAGKPSEFIRSASKVPDNWRMAMTEER